MSHTVAPPTDTVTDPGREDVRIKIDLPLPLDMAATIANLLALAYPGAMIDLRGNDKLVIRIPDGERRRPVKVGKRAAAAARQDASDPETEGSLASWDDEGHIAVALPEEMGRAFAAALGTYLDQHPEAPNYMEWTLHDRKPPFHDYIVYVCRSPEQTPHALRLKAEAERDEALARSAVGEANE